jgi:hypothetical protein
LVGRRGRGGSASVGGSVDERVVIGDQVYDDLEEVGGGGEAGGLSGHICARWSPALVGDYGTAVAGGTGHHRHSRHIGRRDRSAG